MQRDGQRRVALVVAVLDVEARVVLLDPGVLELQRLDLGGDDGPLDGGGRRDHLAGARVQRRQVGEVAVQAAAQALGLADVDDPAGRVAEPVDPRRRRDRPRRRTVRRRVCHALQPTCRRASRRARRDGRGRCPGVAARTAPVPPFAGAARPRRRRGRDRRRRVDRPRSHHRPDAALASRRPARGRDPAGRAARPPGAAARPVGGPARLPALRARRADRGRRGAHPPRPARGDRVRLELARPGRDATVSVPRDDGAGLPRADRAGGAAAAPSAARRRSTRCSRACSAPSRPTSDAPAAGGLRAGAPCRQLAVTTDLPDARPTGGRRRPAPAGLRRARADARRRRVPRDGRRSLLAPSALRAGAARGRACSPGRAVVVLPGHRAACARSGRAAPGPALGVAQVLSGAGWAAWLLLPAARHAGADVDRVTCCSCRRTSWRSAVCSPSAACAAHRDRLAALDTAVLAVALGVLVWALVGSSLVGRRAVQPRSPR